VTTAAGFDQIQAQISRGGVVARNTTAGAGSLRNAPTAGAGINVGTAADFIMSPVTACGEPTKGIQLVIYQTTTAGLSPAIPVGTTWTLTVWVRSSVTYKWVPLPSFAIASNELWINTDLDPCELYFQIAAASIASDGLIAIGVTEVA